MTADEPDAADEPDVAEELDGIDEPDTADETDAVDDERPWTWHLIRVSGLLLAVAIPIHFVVVMIRNDVGRATAASMNTRLDSVTWRVFEWAVLVLALAHGFLAGSDVLASSRLRASVREAVVVSLGVVSVLLALSASAVLLANR